MEETLFNWSSSYLAPMRGLGNGPTRGGRPDDHRSTSGFPVNGQDDTLNNYVVDGIDDNERVIGTIGVKPNVEGIQEITVQTNSYSPEARRTGGRRG